MKAEAGAVELTEGEGVELSSEFGDLPGMTMAAEGGVTTESGVKQWALGLAVLIASYVMRAVDWAMNP